MKLSETILDFENSVGPWLGRTVKIVDYYLQESFKEHGLDLSKEQMLILKILHDQDGLNQNELACLTYRDKSSLARLLATMESKGYIKKMHSKEDKRINIVHLTAKGKDIFNRSRPIIKNTLELMQQNISKEEIRHIIKTLQKIQKNLSSDIKSF